jgi:hypothetical protein
MNFQVAGGLPAAQEGFISMQGVRKLASKGKVSQLLGNISIQRVEE